MKNKKRVVKAENRRISLNARRLWKSSFEALLWNCTTFPCINLRTSYAELVRLHNKHKGDEGACLEEAYTILENGMQPSVLDYQDV